MMSLEKAKDIYKRKGTPKVYIDSLDIPEHEKYVMYNEAIGRESKNNPYKKEAPKKATRKKSAKKEEPKED